MDAEQYSPEDYARAIRTEAGELIDRAGAIVAEVSAHPGAGGFYHRRLLWILRDYREELVGIVADVDAVPATASRSLAIDRLAERLFFVRRLKAPSLAPGGWIGTELQKIRDGERDHLATAEQFP